MRPRSLGCRRGARPDPRRLAHGGVGGEAGRPRCRARPRAGIGRCWCCGDTAEGPTCSKRMRRWRSWGLGCDRDCFGAVRHAHECGDETGLTTWGYRRHQQTSLVVTESTLWVSRSPHSSPIHSLAAVLPSSAPDQCREGTLHRVGGSCFRNARSQIGCSWIPAWRTIDDVGPGVIE